MSEKIDVDALRRAVAARGGLMDLGEFRAALLAVLERIAAALEEANRHDPIAAIDRALAAAGEGEPEVWRAGDALPKSEEWRLR